MFQGIYAPIVTPFQKNEEIDFSKLKHNLDKLGKSKLSGIVVLGSNGEFAYLDYEEKLQLVKFVIENFTKEKKIIVGTYNESTRETIKFSKEVSKLGADAILVLPSNYYKSAMKEDILYRYFTDIADESPIPMMLYNMPGNTGLNLTSSLIARLSKHPNIVGIKDTAGNIVQLSETVRDTDDNFSVFAGNAGYLLPGLAVGIKGATVALGNVLPNECCRVLELFNEGKMKEALKLQQSLIEINFLVTGKYGISGLKYAMDLMGYEGGEVRRPLQPLSEEGKEKIESTIENGKWK
jgi:4-hydroxy-2-oxoglutarate aldolase